MNLLGKKLARDILRLIDRYPAPAWGVLADMLEDPAARRQIVRLLKSAGVFTEQPTKPTSNETKALDLDVLDLEQLRAIAKSSGVPFSAKDSRFRLIRKLRSREVRPRVSDSGPEKPSSYDRWFTIIMDDSRAGKRRG